MKIMEKRYCIHCSQEVEYIVLEQMTTAIVRGENISYMEQIAICPVCNKELYVPEVNDGNLKRKIAAYKNNFDIIKINEIDSILEMYRIGKRPLSKLLGFGEITITRFLDGKTPSKKSSDILKGVLNSIEKMREYIEKNTDETLRSACSKSLEAIKEIDELKRASKIEHIAQYFLMKVEDITNMSLNKLLHFSQVFYFMIFGNPLFDDESQAWVHGPVYPEIYQKYKKHKNATISPIVRSDKLLNLSNEEKCVLDKIIINFGCYNAATLRNMTHVENVWKEARVGLKDEQISKEPIKLETLRLYAQKLREILVIQGIDDGEKYSWHLRQCELNNTLSI